MLTHGLHAVAASQLVLSLLHPVDQTNLDIIVLKVQLQKS
jgi:hypothetical protein